MHAFIYTFYHSFTHSFIHPFIHSFIHPFIHSFIHALLARMHPFTHSSLPPALPPSLLPSLLASLPPVREQHRVHLAVASALSVLQIKMLARVLLVFETPACKLCCCCFSCSCAAADQDTGKTSAWFLQCLPASPAAVVSAVPVLLQIKTLARLLLAFEMPARKLCCCYLSCSCAAADQDPGAAAAGGCQVLA